MLYYYFYYYYYPYVYYNNNLIFFFYICCYYHNTTHSHSVYVGQVDYMTTPEELLGHFEACGTVERVTIVCDKYTGKPKGRYIIILYCIILYHHLYLFSVKENSRDKRFIISSFLTGLSLSLCTVGFAYLEFQVCFYLVSRKF
jgi:hypothetical protein